jgi:hypothetical protein
MTGCSCQQHFHRIHTMFCGAGWHPNVTCFACATYADWFYGFVEVTLANTECGSYVLNMNSPHAGQIERLYEKVAPEWFYRELCQKHGYGIGRGSTVRPWWSG